MPNVKALDSTIHYQESGSGTPFVFLHGNPGSSRMTVQQLPGCHYMHHFAHLEKPTL